MRGEVPATAVVPNRIREQRLRAGMTMRQLAERSGVNKDRLSLAERQGCNLSDADKLAVVAALTAYAGRQVRMSDVFFLLADPAVA